MMGVSRSIISLYETNKRELTKKRIIQIARIFHVSITLFFDESIENLDGSLSIHEEGLDRKTYLKATAIIREYRDNQERKETVEVK